MNLSNLIILSISILYTLSNAYAQENPSLKYAETITANDLKAHLTIVASDSFEGRNTGDRGQKLAAQYIANQFATCGLTPPVKKGDSLSNFQTFNVYKRSWSSCSLTINNKKKDFMKDFFSLANPSLPTEEQLEVVFGGYDGKLSVDIKGKAVVMFLGKILENETSSYTQKVNNLILTSNYNKEFKQLLDKGAKAVFLIPGGNDSSFTNFLAKYKCALEEPDVFLIDKKLMFNNLFFIPFSLGAEMLGIKNEQLSKLQRKTAYSKSDLKGIKLQKVSIQASKKVEPVSTENVLGYLEGGDKKDELLVITAHYDHEGIKCGEIYNGADDDGTGTVSILEMANAFSQAKKEGHGPSRSILFMTVTGEEKGLLGSSYYTQHPVFPLANTIVDLNIDMIGRMDENHQDENYVYLIGSDRLSTQLHKVSEEINSKYIQLNLDYTYNASDDPNQFYYRSDHYNFAKNNIPVIFYFSGVHEDYHRPTDDVDKILFNKVEKTARLIFLTAWELANRKERITVDVK